jgi:hypothetical protein
MKKPKRFKTGFCDAGNHSHCRGAIRRPGDEAMFCTCTCHRGQEVAPPEEYVRPVSEEERLAREMDELFSQLVVRGQIDIPCSEDGYRSVARTRYVEDSLRVRVV